MVSFLIDGEYCRVDDVDKHGKTALHYATE